tara:strand:+ start:264 stop:716 length:453 start_codon:yes stop_codon:yes gene_type:complete
MKIIILLLLVFIDFLTKKIIFNNVGLNSFIEISQFIDITHIHNFGVSFGLFSGFFSSLTLVFIGVLIIFFLFYWMINANSNTERWAINLLIAGGISNILDRSINGYVLDFIYLHYNQFYWPAFNFADIYISFGVIMILINYIWYFKKNKI